MNLSFRSSDLLDSIIVDSKNDAPVYKTESHNLVHRVTLLNKFVPDLGEFQPVADLHWEDLSFKSSYVVYRGQKIKMSDFLHSKHLLSSTKLFVATDDKQYEWKPNYWHFQKLVLYDDSKNVVAESHRKHYGLFHKKQDYNIDIVSAGIPILDDIMVSFLIMYRWEETKRQAQNAAVVSVS